MFKIHFQLQNLDNIIPWGGETAPSLHWFGLTDGLLWISAGTHTVYEYSHHARKFWNEDIHYNNYQLSRFLEDFSQTFPFICESVPEPIYQNIENFMSVIDKWKSSHENLPDDAFDNWYDTFCEPLAEWFWQQNSFDSCHLTAGYQIGCFRFQEHIKFWWDNYGRTLPDGMPVWTSQKGSYEMLYSDFVSEVQRFFRDFFQAMDIQVQNAVSRDWGRVQLDKIQLIREHQHRKETFQQKIDALSQTPQFPRNWNNISALWQNCLDDVNST